jgi:phosphate butyryltransferase
MLTSFDSVITAAKEREGSTIVVAGAEGHAVLEAVKMARESGIMEPILIGNLEKIQEIAHEVNLNLEGIMIHHEITEESIVDDAVKMVHTGEADGLMKGKISTPSILKAVLNKKFNLRTDRLLSHIALLEIPTYHKLLMVTDGGMVIQPTLEQKADILRNGAQMMQKLGVAKPKVGILAAIETVNSAMPETIHAQQLCEMAQKGKLGNVEVEGPLAVDVVFSPEAAKIKGVDSRISGDPDILLVPSIACGNIFAKGLWHLANAKIGGLILGARKPIILLSRSDNAETKMNSIALGVVTS